MREWHIDPKPRSRAMSNLCHRVGRARLDEMAARMSDRAPHLLGIVTAVRDFGAQFMFVPQMSTPMMKELNVAQRPFIAIVGDDTDRAVGPEYFDKPSLERLIGMADIAAVVACEPRRDVYGGLSMLAGLFGHNALIVETRPEQEIPWTQAIQAAKPNLPLIICTVAATPQ
jgi:hypothetical protein